MPGNTRKKKSSTANKSPKKPPVKHHLKRGGIAVAILTVLVLVVGLVVHWVVKEKHASRKPETAVVAAIPHPTKVPVPPVVRNIPPPFEIFPPTEPTITPSVPEEKVHTALPEKKPRIAIIIDDIGYDQQIAEKFINLNTPITLSILPHSPHQRQIVLMARKKGLEIMLHLPMEPLEYPGVNPGPGALLTRMSPDELIRQLNDDIDSVPYIKGINNHMGSKLTASSEQMNQIISGIKKRDLFFIDSRTTPDSRVRSSAKLFQIPYAERDIFLDHVQEPDAIRRQFRRLEQKAITTGQAVAIGHPHAVTLQILREELPEILKKLTIVPASTMVRPVG